MTWWHNKSVSGIFTSSSLHCEDLNQAGEGQQLHWWPSDVNAYPATLLMFAGWATVVSLRIPDLPRYLVFSEGTGATRVVSVGGRRRVCGAEQSREEISPLWLDGLVKQSHTSRSPSLPVWTSREERSWSSEVLTCIPELRTVSPL